jgi:dipeptidyl aminopeptidase/acylaminoacyl peptidase
METVPYGSWKSPITADLLIEGTVSLYYPTADGNDLFWLEQRPQEKGRQVIVRRAADGTISDVTPSEFNARTRVHEYGGRPFIVSEGVVYFSNDSDKRLYAQRIGEAPRPISPDIGDVRFADFIVDKAHRRLICVCEDHTKPDIDPLGVNSIMSLPLDGGDLTILVSGNDFYSSPALRPNGKSLIWLAWNYPNMPWDDTEVWIAKVADDGALSDITKLQWGERESHFQPQWSSDGVLHFVSDRTGWWNLYRDNHPLYPMEAEFGAPQWVFGLSTYAFLSDTQIVCIYQQNGYSHLAVLDIPTRTLSPISTPFNAMAHLTVANGQVFMMAGSALMGMSVVQLNPATGDYEILRRPSSLAIDEEYISQAEAIEFPTENGLTAHAFFYRSQNKDFIAPEGTRPPLIVMSHGGPTSATSPALKLTIQFWTSRGFAVVDVNYGGSTGYGRAYQERLNGQWGVVDVADCVNAARYLAAQSEVDADKMTITGSSAGGYAVLCAMIFHDVFRAGTSRYGIGDLKTLAEETHKFESRYNDGLVGPYPERADLYQERSPIHFTQRLTGAILLMHGTEDKVVPPNQSQTFFEAARARELPTAYIKFEGEGHGFRRAENIKRALEAELYFYAQIFGFALADDIEPIEIENL